ncbi:MAG TPA: hypothetical protein PLM16_00090 [Candidatus Woesebacteria bacterium]|nr:hypothetical protein [Candidatus Woesebacteria bacterium]
MNNLFSGISSVNNIPFNHILLLIFKLLLDVGGVLYLVFAVVVVRQISIMKKTLITPLSPLISLLGYLHLLFAILALSYFLLLMT